MSTNNGAALAVPAPPQSLAALTWNDMQDMAVTLVKGRVFGFTSPEQVLTLMLIAHAQGRHPALVALEYDIIQGRAALKSAVMVARHQASGGTIEIKARTETRCLIKVTGPNGDAVEIEWNDAKAAAAGLLGKDNWKRHKREMHYWRASAEGIRAVNPGVLFGMHTDYEVQDMEHRGDVSLASDPTPAMLAGDFSGVPLAEREAVNAQIEDAVANQRRFAEQPQDAEFVEQPATYDEQPSTAPPVEDKPMPQLIEVDVYWLVRNADHTRLLTTTKLKRGNKAAAPAILVIPGALPETFPEPTSAAPVRIRAMGWHNGKQIGTDWVWPLDPATLEVVQQAQEAK